MFKILGTAIIIALIIYGALEYIEWKQLSEFETESVLPEGTPGQSAPEQAVNVCTGKTEQQECSFALKKLQINGVCQISGNNLACTPQLPE